MIRLNYFIGLLSLLLFEVLYYMFGESNDLELYIAGWIFVYLTILLFTYFNVKGKSRGIGNVGNNFGFLAYDKVEKVFQKPKRSAIGKDTQLLVMWLTLLVINIAVYIMFYVI